METRCGCSLASRFLSAARQKRRCADHTDRKAAFELVQCSVASLHRQWRRLAEAKGSVMLRSDRFSRLPHFTSTTRSCKSLQVAFRPKTAEVPSTRRPEGRE
jgi:hypothetical protein